MRDIADLFPPSVRVIYIAYEQEDYSPDSVAGRRQLRTIVDTPSDDKVVEDILTGMRDAERSNRCNKTAPLSRMYRCYNSGVLEGRDMRVVRASKEDFSSVYF